MTEKKRTKAQQVADVLTKEIILGQYRTGERLPSERDLAARFGTSRARVREAFQKLEQLGIADIQPGGARVNPLDMANLDVIGTMLKLSAKPEPKLLRQITEVMDAIVALAVRKAVERASDDDIDEIRAVVEMLLAGNGKLSEQINTQIELMHHFLRASENLVLHLISNSLRMQISDTVTPLAAASRLDAATTTRILKKLDKALQDRKAEVAADAVRLLNHEISTQIVKASEL